jgi:polysaccharide export outer membrane protein
MRCLKLLVVFLAVAVIAGCGRGPSEELPSAGLDATSVAPTYVIGPLDTVSVFVWRNPDISTTATVRPDGRVTIPLVEELQAAGKTSTELARDIEGELEQFILDPIVSVTVGDFVGPFDQQVRIVGEAAEPQAIPFRANMTVLDVMIAVGGLTEFAAGNSTTLVRLVDGQQQEFRVRLDDLLQDGDFSANVQVLPGDVIIVPESFF